MACTIKESVISAHRQFCKRGYALMVSQHDTGGQYGPEVLVEESCNAGVWVRLLPGPRTNDFFINALCPAIREARRVHITTLLGSGKEPSGPTRTVELQTA